MSKPIFQFGNVVVNPDNQIGVIVKTWGPSTKTGEYSYEVYVRSLNTIAEYREVEVSHFVYSKELSEDEKEFY
jgi:hypothetical protein